MRASTTASIFPAKPSSTFPPDTVGTRAEDAVYKRMRMSLTTAYRKLHNQLHQRGHYHEHTPATHHPEHRG